MTIDGILIATNKMYQLFGNVKDIMDIEYYKERIVFKTAEKWYAYNLDDDTITVYTDENHVTYGRK